MKNSKQRKVYEPEIIENYRELMKRIKTKFGNNIAYKYKKKPGDKEIIQKTYNQYIDDVKALSTSLLELGYEGKKVALIGNNRYEWCTTYMAVTTGNMIIVPIDKALPDNEIENLITRSGVEIAFFDKKYNDIMLKLKNKENSVTGPVFGLRPVGVLPSAGPEAHCMILMILLKYIVFGKKM